MESVVDLFTPSKECPGLEGPSEAHESLLASKAKGSPVMKRSLLYRIPYNIIMQ